MTFFSLVIRHLTEAIHKLRADGPRLTNVGSSRPREWHYELVENGQRIRITVEEVDE